MEIIIIIFEISLIWVDESKIKILLISVNIIIIKDNLSWMKRFNNSMFVFKNLVIKIISDNDRIIINIFSLFQNMIVNNNKKNNLNRG